MYTNYKCTLLNYNIQRFININLKVVVQFTISFSEILQLNIKRSVLNVFLNLFTNKITVNRQTKLSGWKAYILSKTVGVLESFMIQTNFSLLALAMLLQQLGSFC